MNGTIQTISFHSFLLSDPFVHELVDIHYSNPRLAGGMETEKRLAILRASICAS
jgi:hypothetical protein